MVPFCAFGGVPNWSCDGLLESIVCILLCNPARPLFRLLDPCQSLALWWCRCASIVVRSKPSAAMVEPSLKKCLAAAFLFSLPDPANQASDLISSTARTLNMLASGGSNIYCSLKYSSFLSVFENGVKNVGCEAWCTISLLSYTHEAWG